MPTLRELQTLFESSLLAGDETAVIQQIEGDGLDPRARLAVYRHHVFTTLTAVLETAYPVVCRLVDRRFFAYAADAFIKRYAPRRPHMPDPFEYISRARLEYRGGARNAFLGEVPEPVVYGVQGALREYYGAPPGPPVASTLDHIVAAVAG